MPTDKTKEVFWVFSIEEHMGTRVNEYNTPTRSVPYSGPERCFTRSFDTYEEAVSAIDAYFKDEQFRADELIIQKVYTYDNR